MAMIDRELYEVCEARLRDRFAAVDRARERLEEARARAYSVQQAPPDPNGGSHGQGRGDKLERAAIAVHEAEEQLRQALAWQDVGTKLARIYPLSSPEGRAGDLIYNRGMTQADCCLQMHRDRKTVRRYQDAYIMNALLLAVQAGLLRLGGGDGAAEKMD